MPEKPVTWMVEFDNKTIYAEFNKQRRSVWARKYKTCRQSEQQNETYLIKNIIKWSQKTNSQNRTNMRTVTEIYYPWKCLKIEQFFVTIYLFVQ